MSRPAGRVVAARLVGAAAAAALVVSLLPTAGTAASKPTVERRKIGKSVILVASEPRPHAKPTKRTPSTVSDFDGDGVDDLAVAGDSDVTIGSDETGGAVAVRYSSVQRDDVLFGTANRAHGTRCSNFGLSGVATGDFNRDRYDDLVVAETCESVPGTESSGFAGALWVLPGSQSGLHLSAARLISRATSGVAGVPTPDERFGSALATGDLDGDGYDDLAVGMTETKVSGASGAGSVVVLYGRKSGLSGSGSRMITQATSGVPGWASRSGRFGASLAIGRVTADSYADLVVGVPGAGVEPRSGDAAGGVVLVPGGRYGVAAAKSSMVSGRDLDAAFRRAGHDTWTLNLGSSIATADLNGDGRDEVIAGAPSASPADLERGGFIVSVVARGTSLSLSGARLFSLETPGMPGDVETWDGFGAELAVADIDLDGRDELAVGAPGRDLSGRDSAGAVYLVRGATSGLGSRGVAVLTQASAGVPGNPGSGHGFGAALAFLDVDGSGRRDLVVGTPGDRLTTDTSSSRSGSVTVFRNVWGKLTPDERWGGRAAGIGGVLQRLTDFGVQVA
ncbi:integrin alpha [Cellulomonas sp. DKR-3]|uniref:Integrin alpha n=1 Tax=Cellulomonas fulva TaxID=2835530 RepID=A0ABS5TUY2_9CELL|nr:integrin alpha [Cellulomonas fulva]MBT0992959.1 integrin alpha [Cellulomonas fulva]